MDVARQLGTNNQPPRFTVFEGGALRTSRAERFRANADECDRLASQSLDPRVKAQFTDLASDWRHLAEQVESIAHDRESALNALRAVGKSGSERE
jgi:hypothetical protein